MQGYPGRNNQNVLGFLVPRGRCQDAYTRVDVRLVPLKFSDSRRTSQLDSKSDAMVSHVILGMNDQVYLFMSMTEHVHLMEVNFSKQICCYYQKLDRRVRWLDQTLAVL